jgi:hypothetical protein
MRYSIYEAVPFRMFRCAAHVEAETDQKALREARRLLPGGRGELRQEQRVVCRFGIVDR